MYIEVEQVIATDCPINNGNCLECPLCVNVDKNKYGKLTVECLHNNHVY